MTTSGGQQAGYGVVMVYSDALSEGIQPHQPTCSPCWWYSVVPSAGRKELTADARELKGSCTACHATTRWVPICVPAAHRGRWQRHGQAVHVEVSACGGCNGASQYPRLRGARLLWDAEGRVRPLGDSQLCGKLRTLGMARCCDQPDAGRPSTWSNL